MMDLLHAHCVFHEHPHMHTLTHTYTSVDRQILTLLLVAYAAPLRRRRHMRAHFGVQFGDGLIEQPSA